jgi:hypothetical protein
LALASETLRGSGDISHLQIFFCEFLPLYDLEERKFRKFCGADFLGVALDLQETGAALAGM